jgi:hypothetical protein
MEIPHPDSERLILDGCRRLTGPSLVWSKTGAILDVLLRDIDQDQVLDCWYRHVNALLSQLHWQQPKLTHRRFENGLNLLLAAPIDQLYSAVLVLETAWYFCTCELLEVTVESRDQLIQDIFEEMQSEKNDALIALQQAATDHGTDFLVDDDVVSIGHGDGSSSYNVGQIPPVEQIDWDSIHDIPVAMITGTNGKSTSVRLLDGIARAAGQVSGVTSTDFVRVGDDILDQGDYSGPYGVNTLAALTETKFAVSKTLAENGMLVTNADDSGIVEFLAGRQAQNLCWFSLDKSNPEIQQQIKNNGRCCFEENGFIVYFDGQQFEQICAVNDIPMTLNGAALHNLRNALGAVGVATAMGYTTAQLAAGLSHFNSDEHDNPGRLNSFELNNSARVIVDFAHNAHSVAAVADTVGRMPARQKWALFGSAGDRSDDEIAAIARGVCALEPNHVVITEVEGYLRGRALGEVSEIMKQACLQSGLAESQIIFAESPLAGVKLAVSRMQSDDLGLFLVLSERDQVIDYLKSQ